MKYSIEGGSLPVVILQLEPGEGVISEAGGRTWVKGNVNTEASAEGGLGKSIGRMFMGESLFMSRYTAQGAAEIAFASSFPGKIIARTLQPGESIVCQKSAFMCATTDVDLSIHFQKKLGSGFFGGEGFIMERVTGPGLVFLEIDGYCKEYDLQPGERIICDTGALAVMDIPCQRDVQMVNGVKNLFFGREGLFDTVVTGPGKVYMQSMTMPNIAQEIIPFIPQQRS